MDKEKLNLEMLRSKLLARQLTVLSNSYIEKLMFFVNFIDSSAKKVTKHGIYRGEKRSFAKSMENYGSSFKVKSANIMEDLAKKSPKEKTSNDEKISLTKEQAKFLWPLLLHLKFSEILGEMSLTYLISLLEAYVKDYFYCILTNNPEMLKSSAQMRYEDILKHSSMNELIHKMAQKEVDEIGYKSIDLIQEYFEDKLNIDITQFAQWNIIHEASYRRNLVIHNQAQTNEIYCKAVGHKRIGESIQIDIDYVGKLIIATDSFIRFVFEKSSKKFKLPRDGDRLFPKKTITIKKRYYTHIKIVPSNVKEWEV